MSQSTAESDDPPEDEPAPGTVYAFKPSLMSGGSFFRLREHGMDWQIGRHSGHMRYREIRRLRLAFRPVSLATHRFIAEIWGEGAPKMTIASTSWRSFVEQQRQDEEYSAFVRTLIARIGAAGATPRLETGSPPLIYWPGAALCVALGLAFPWMLVRALREGATGAAGVIAVLLAILVWQIGTFFWRNWPGAFRPSAIPSAVLPGR